MTTRLRPVVDEPAGIEPASLGRRTVTAVLYALVILAALGLGVTATAIVLGVMAAGAAAEFYALQRRESRLPNEFIGTLAAFSMPLAAARWGLAGPVAVLTALVAASLLWHTLIMRVRTADTAETVFGAIYTGFLLSYVVSVRALDAGLALALLLIVSVWAGDVAAYLIGSLLGRHKLAPGISPKKSWEGFAAGTVATTLAWSAVAPVTVPGVPLPFAAAVGFSIALASTIGDLAESRIKREAGVKDSGRALPGHGGFLDRLDSLTLAGLVAYWVLHWGGIR